MKPLVQFFCLSLFTFHLSLPTVWAHAGHAHAATPGEEGGSTAVTGPIELTTSAIQNLAVETSEAALIPLQKSFSLPARIEPLPERNAQITARFEGTVLELLVKLGEPVKKDQPLLKLDPLLIGNPPVIYRSPLKGYVTQLNLNQGSSFTAGTALMQVSDDSQVLVKGTTYEREELTEIKVGQPVRIVSDLYPNEVLSGSVQRLDVGLESESRTFEIYALLDNVDRRLRPNQQASMTVGVGEAAEVLAIPQRAVLGETGNLFVFVRDGNRFERRTVTLGLKAGDRVEILEGVFPGELVVTQGNYQLQYAPASEEGSVKREESQPEKPSSLIWLWWTLAAVLSLGSVIAFIKLRHS
jgi:membrane fusion protein, heavy metal efflux system